MSCEQTACPRQAPPRAACSPRLGRPVGREGARHGSLQFRRLTGSHPLKFPRFSNGLCVPRLPGGRFFAQSSAHLFAVLCANRRTFPKTSRTAPICCIFLQQTPSFCPMGERPFSYPPTPSHDRDPRSSISRCPHAFGVPERAGPGPIRKLFCSTPAQHKEPPGSELFFLPPINRDRTLRTSYPAREPAQVAIIFVAFLQNSAKQPPFLCEQKYSAKSLPFYCILWYHRPNTPHRRLPDGRRRSYHRGGYYGEKDPQGAGRHRARSPSGCSAPCFDAGCAPSPSIPRRISCPSSAPKRTRPTSSAKTAASRGPISASRRSSPCQAKEGRRHPPGLRLPLGKRRLRPRL